MAKLDTKHKMFKPVSVQIKEIDSDEGIVDAYANVYHNEDWDGDISDPSSFVKTVDENAKKLRVYKNHNSDIELGVPRKKPDAHDPYGLLTSTLFNLEKEVSRDMLSDIKLKMKYEKDVDLSIGFQVIRRDEKDRRIIKEYALWEYSFLTNWGANALATVVSAKGHNLTHADRANSVVSFLTDAYNLKYSDPRLIKIEELLKSLTNAPGVVPPIQEPTPDEMKSLILNAFK